MDSACLLMDHGAVRMASFTLPSLDKGEVLIKTHYSCISPGTELRCLDGGQDGTAEAAFIPGYALCGEIMESNSFLEKGQRVFCSGTIASEKLQRIWGGHVACAVADAQTCTIIPETVDSRAASLSAMGAIAHHGMTLSKPQAGEDVITVGLGVIGQLSARMHAAAGADVLACDLSAPRVALSNAAGIRAVSAANGLVDACAAEKPDGATLIIDASGAPRVLPQAMLLARTIPWTDDPQVHNRYLIQGSYAGDFSVPYQSAFERQLTFIVPRARQGHDVDAFLKLIVEKKVDVLDLIVDIVKPDAAAEAYAALRDPEQAPGTFLFDWT